MDIAEIWALGLIGRSLLQLMKKLGGRPLERRHRKVIQGRSKGTERLGRWIPGWRGRRGGGWRKDGRRSP